MQDFMAALKEVKPAFGAVVETLDSYRLNGITNWGPGFEHLAATCRTLVEQARLQLMRTGPGSRGQWPGRQQHGQPMCCMGGLNAGPAMLC